MKKLPSNSDNVNQVSDAVPEAETIGSAVSGAPSTDIPESGESPTKKHANGRTFDPSRLRLSSDYPSLAGVKKQVLVGLCLQTLVLD